MMRMNISQVVDGVAFHAEVDGVEEAKEYLSFLNSISQAALSSTFDLSKILPGATVQAALPMDTATVAAPPSQVKAEAQGQKWTRENLQPIVVNLAKQRDKFVALLQQFGVARFRDLPDDKLNDFGIACEGAAA